MGVITPHHVGRGDRGGRPSRLVPSAGRSPRGNGRADYDQAQTFDGHQAVGIAVFQLLGTNALDIAERVRAS